MLGGSSKSRKADWTPMPPLVIAAAVLILLGTVILMAVRDINGQKRQMSYILEEKGTAIIRALEAGARTGIARLMWGSSQMQSLLEEASRHPEILYMGVADDKGVILAHSNKDRIGEKMPDNPPWDISQNPNQEKWRMLNLGSGQRAFEVYRAFRPLHGKGMIMGRMGRGPGPDPQAGRAWMDWCLSVNPNESGQVIFVGLDMKPFEAARWNDIRGTILISGLIALMGLGGFLAVFWLQSYRVTKRMLQDASAFADEVVSSLPVGLVAVDSNGRIAFFNHSAEIITGAPRSQTMGEEAARVFDQSLSGLKPLLDQNATVAEREMECSFAGKGLVPLSVSASDIVNEEGHYVGRILILRDLGEVRKLQEQIRRQEKLSAIGELAAGVAHEIRNPLSSIKGLASYFGQRFDPESEDAGIASGMVREVDRLNRVVSQLLDFARPSDLNLKPTDINELAAHSLNLVRQDAKARNIGILAQTQETPAMAMADADRFSQCLLNLYLNAMAAMDPGGLLTVRTSTLHNGDILVEVEDTGRGIPPGDLNRIFDPYYTTKPSGTGLGLAIVHKILEGHNARIRVESRLEKGTLFSMTLPGTATP